MLLPISKLPYDRYLESGKVAKVCLATEQMVTTENSRLIDFEGKFRFDCNAVDIGSLVNFEPDDAENLFIQSDGFNEQASSGSKHSTRLDH